MSKPANKKTQAEASKQKGQAKGTKGKGTSAPSIIDCNQFDINKFYVEELDLKSAFNTKKGGQLITFPRYKYGPSTTTSFTFRTKPIKFTQYGIKKIDNEFVKTDEDREYMRIPYDPDQPACVELFKMFEKLDEYFEKNKATVLGPLAGSAKLFDYQPIVRTPQAQDDLVLPENDDKKKKGKDKDAKEEEAKPEKPRMKYAKVKFVTDFESHELKTFVFTRENGTPELQKDVKTMTALHDNYLKFLSVCQFVITASKVWFAKNKDKSGKRAYGLTFKCPQMEVLEKPSTGGDRQQFTTYAFSNNETNEEEEEEEEKENENEDDKKAEGDEIEGDDDDDDDDDDDNDDGDDDDDDDDEDDKEESEEEEEQETKKPSPKSPPKKNK